MKDFAVQSSFRDGKPWVILIYGDEKTAIASSEAQKLGVAIIEAISVAEAEVRLAQVVAGDRPVGGVGQAAREAQASWERAFGGTLLVLREHRPPGHPAVSAIYVFHSRKTLIEISAWKEKAQVEVDEARNFASWLLVAAEAAATDAFLDRFLRRDGRLDEDAVPGFIAQFALFRSQLNLEGLLNLESGSRREEGDDSKPN